MTARALQFRDPPRPDPGTAWYEASGHDLLTTQQLPRHASVASTQGYAQISRTRTSEVALAMKDVSA